MSSGDLQGVSAKTGGPVNFSIISRKREYIFDSPVDCHDLSYAVRDIMSDCLIFGPTPHNRACAIAGGTTTAYILAKCPAG